MNRDHGAIFVGLSWSSSATAPSMCGSPYGGEKAVLEDMDRLAKAKKAAILVPKRTITSPMSIP